ncbi:MAG: 6,7-dimethyl-8-ribityllumazine synthase [Stappiaceae bacterium]
MNQHSGTPANSNKDISDKGIPGGKSIRIAVIRAQWHTDIVDQCRQAFVARMVEFGILDGRIEIFDVPGSYEIPLQAKMLAKTGRYELVACCGFVIDGGIYRHDFVAQAVINGMMQVQLETEVPVLSAVLTPHHFHETAEHQKFYYSHFRRKGEELAVAARKVLENRRHLEAVSTLAAE